jgi:hypothetical protein
MRRRVEREGERERGVGGESGGSGGSGGREMKIIL